MATASTSGSVPSTGGGVTPDSSSAPRAFDAAATHPFVGGVGGAGVGGSGNNSVNHSTSTSPLSVTPPPPPPPPTPATGTANSGDEHRNTAAAAAAAAAASAATSTPVSSGAGGGPYHPLVGGQLPPTLPFDIGAEAAAAAVATNPTTPSSSGSATAAAAAARLRTAPSAAARQHPRKHGHRRVYSAVEGSAAQQFLLDGLVDSFVSTLPGPVGAAGDAAVGAEDATTPPQGASRGNTNSGGSALRRSPEKQVSPTTAGDAGSWNVLATERSSGGGGGAATTPTSRGRASGGPAWHGNEDNDGMVRSAAKPAAVGGAIRGRGGGHVSLTSSTRSLMSNYSTDPEEEDLAGLVVRADGALVVDEDEDEDESITGGAISSSGYVSGTSASASAAAAAAGAGVNNAGSEQRHNHGGAKVYRDHHARNATRGGVRRSSGGLPPTPMSAATGNTSIGEDTGQDNAVLRAIGDLRSHVDRSLGDWREGNRRDLERVFHVIQQESMKRTALEGRLHSQLLLQSETMVAMELKLLRLEAKVERREAAQRQRRQLSGGGGSGVGGVVGGLTIPATPALGLGLVGQQGQPLPTISALSPSPNTIDEEDAVGGPAGGGADLGSVEILGNPRGRGGLPPPPRADRGPPGPSVVVSSGASLASAVTATSFLDGDSAHIADDGSTKGSTIDEDDRASRSSDGDVEDEGDEATDEHNDGSASTPTQSSRNQFATLDSILLNPMINSGVSEHGTSTRATRGDMDGNSSLATSVTSATLTSTVVTATTRGDSVANPHSRGGSGRSRLSADHLHDDDEDEDEEEEIGSGSAAGGRPGVVGGVGGGGPAGGGGGVVDVVGSAIAAAGGSAGRPSRNGSLDEALFGLSPPPHHGGGERAPRSRSQSPLTVQSETTASVGPRSMASASIGTSILSTAAVAPARSFSSRRAAAAAAAAAAASGSGSVGGGIGEGGTARPLANRVVSFTSNEIFALQPPHGAAAYSEAGDSITMPDELDNLSDVADAFASSSRLWREEYEARLDAIQKRWAAE